MTLSRILPPNVTLLLENELVLNGNCGYLNEINDLFRFLGRMNVDNIGFCLDLGHLLFGFYKEGTSQEQVLFQLERMSYILHRIKEFHIHDYSEIDHLHLQDGLMDLKLISDFIIKNNLIVPIIIETTIRKPEQDGIEQIQIMTKYLRESLRRCSGC